MTSYDIDALQQTALTALDAAQTLDDLEEWRRAWIGRQGAITSVLRDLKNLSDAEKRTIGSAANALREELEEAHQRKRNAVTDESSNAPLVDVTVPGHRTLHGHRHPLTIVRRDIEDYFAGLGFEVVEGPEAETEYYNFDALNIPADHPARDMWDTLWLNHAKGALLRTHTSPMQVRYMEQNKPPFRIIVPGRTFRHEATDATHFHTFDQVEGLMVGTDVTLAHLKYVVQGLFERLLTHEVEVRFRPAYFPFTEPSVEVEVLWEGQWLEMMGAGMVNQAVFKAADYAPDEWRGFAFGLGVDRVAMVKYGIDDIRLLYENDLRFLEQF